MLPLSQSYFYGYYIIAFFQRIVNFIKKRSNSFFGKQNRGSVCFS